jgi:hypothetical protein
MVRPQGKHPDFTIGSSLEETDNGLSEVAMCDLCSGTITVDLRQTKRGHRTGRIHQALQRHAKRCPGEPPPVKLGTKKQQAQAEARRSADGKRLQKASEKEAKKLAKQRKAISKVAVLLGPYWTLESNLADEFNEVIRLIQIRQLG